MKRWACQLCGQTIRTPYTLPTPPVCTHKNTSRAAARPAQMTEEPPT